MTAKNLLYFCLVLFTICLFCLNKYFTHDFRMGIFYNSDSLYIPQLAAELKSGFGVLGDWNLSRAPSFIDGAVYFLIHLMFNSYFSIIVFSLLQIAFTFWLVYWIYSYHFSTEFSVVLAGLSMTGVLILILQGFHPYVIILKSAHHFSEFLIWMILSLLFVKYLTTYKMKLLISINAISLIQILSDQLILIHFVAPAMATLIILLASENGPQKAKLLMLLSLLAVSLMALFLSLKLTGAETSAPSWEHAIDSMKTDAGKLLKLFQQVWTGSAIVALTFVTFCLGVFRLVINKKVAHFLKIYFFLVVVVTISVPLMLPDKNILFRYLLPLMYTPLLFWGYVIPREKERLFQWPLLLFTVSIYGYLCFSVPLGNWRSEFYPDHIRCIDAHASSHGFKHVAGGFWDGRNVSFLSQSGVMVQPFTGQFKIDDKVSNLRKTGKFFDAFIIDTKNGKGLKGKAIRNRFGEPSEIIICPNHELYVYNDNSFVLDQHGTLVRHEIK